MTLLFLAEALLLGTALAASAVPKGNVITIIDSKDYDSAFHEIFNKCAGENFADDNFEEFKTLFSDSIGLTSDLKSFSQLFILCISKAKSRRVDARQFFQGLTTDNSALSGWGYEGLWRLGEAKDADFIIADANRRKDRRRQAGFALSNLKHPSVAPFLFESFELETDSLRRRDLLVDLAATGSTLTISAARISMDSLDWSNRRMAAGLLAKFEGKDSIPLLISKLNDPKDLVRSSIVDALGLIGDPTPVAVIRNLQKDSSPAVRERVINSRVGLGAATDDDFQIALQDQDSHVRETARLIYSAKGAGVNFVKISKEASPLARADAAIQLGRIWGKNAAPRLKELLHDTDPGVQSYAAIALWANGRSDGEVILRKRLESTSDHDEFLEIASAFGRIGNEKSLKSLERIYHSNWSPAARSNAAIMFYGIGESASLETIKNWKLQEHDPAVKKTISDIIEGKY